MAVLEEDTIVIMKIMMIPAAGKVEEIKIVVATIMMMKAIAIQEEVLEA